MLKRTLVLLGTVIAVLAAAASASAATITVNATSDDNSQGDGQCSLRKAIEDVDSPGSSQTDCAPAAFGANTIALGANTYVLGFVSPNDLAIAPTVTNLTITGAGAGQTFINAQPLGNRVFEISPGATVAISDLTIKSGHAPTGTGSSGTGGANGGAILNGGTLALTHAAITNSQAGSGGPGAPGGTGGNGGSGGAIYNSGALSMDGVTISNDQAGNGGTGGAGSGGGTTGGNGGTGGSGGDGGGITNAGGSVTINGATLNGNSAGGGGNGGNGGSGTATGGAGGTGGQGANGGGLSTDGGSISVTNATFASDAAGSGGAGGIGGAGPTAGAGGHGGAGGSGGGVAGATPTSATLLQTTSAGNKAGAPGAGGTGGTAGTAGSAGTAGGLFDQGSGITLENSLLSTNQPGGNCGGSILDGGYNLSSGDSSCPNTFASGDPNLGALQDNGGPAPTISLGPGSAAIDQIPATGAHCPATDERGVPRPSGSKCDIGAYEVAPPIAATNPASNTNLTGATLNAHVTPNAGTSTVTFQYGRSAGYGKTTSNQQVGGVIPTAVSAKLSHLRPNTTYHFRVVVVAMDGTNFGADQTFVTSLAPIISHLKVKPRAVKSSGSAKVTYMDSAAAKTTFTVLLCTKVSRGHCTATKRVRRFKHHDRAGANKFTLKGRGLSVGTYLLAASPRAAGHTGRTVSFKFKIT